MSTSSTLKRTAILNVVGLSPRHIGPDTPYISDFLDRPENRIAHVEPLIPAVTCSMQATYLTGKTPAEHGVVGNYWYDREYDEHRGWKQSEHLIKGRKLWEHLRETDPEFTCAKIFWWFNMYSSADYTITPRPIYCADGKKVFDVQTAPMKLTKKLKRKIGKFPFQAFWGPMAGIDSSHWIARSAKWFEEQYSPNLNLVYLPHLDYNLQRIGPEGPHISMDLGQIDAVVGDLIRFYENRDVKVVLLSEYGITQVDRAIHINRLFREKGWLVWRDELRKEQLDLGSCQAFAVVDHQVAHIYVNDKSILGEVRNAVTELDGVAQVMDGSMRNYYGMEHPRAGDLIAVSDEKSWFTYYWWEKDRKAPDYARTVDIHRKPGYDPVELFMNPKFRNPKLKAGMKVLRKKLGFRTLMNLIPLDADLVKGSHGAIPASEKDWPVVIGDMPNLSRDGAKIQATEVYRHLMDVCSR